MECTAEAESELRELLRAPEVVAAGECGLDYFRDLAPRHAQRRAFERQLELSVEAGKPLFLHQRDAHSDFMAVLREFQGRLGPVVVHCFTGTGEEMDECIAAGYYIGITGWLCDERRGLHLREIVPRIPQDRLLIETDAPYLLPRSVKPAPSHRRNEPMYLRHIVEELARDRGESVERTAAISTANARRFFALPPAPAFVSFAPKTTIGIRACKMAPLHMMQGSGGLERTKTEFAALLADSGFEATQFTPTGLDHWVIDASGR